jgi:hypothetical protein
MPVVTSSFPLKLKYACVLLPLREPKNNEIVQLAWLSKDRNMWFSLNQQVEIMSVFLSNMDGDSLEE